MDVPKRLSRSVVFDAKTPAVRLTPHAACDDQLLYFTSSSVTSDEQALVFISYREGRWNIFSRNLRTGQERQLSRNVDGFLKSYVYFNGTPYRGLARASPCLHGPSKTVFYIQGRQICRADLDGKWSVLGEYPSGQMTAFTHVSADGTRLCVPTVDARALDGDTQLSGQPSFNIDARVRQERLSSYLRIYDTTTGKELAIERVEGAWITHVQFSPLDRDLILYNNEWPSDCGIRRIWLWNGREHIRLRNEGVGRSRGDWVCHEMWERNGEAVIYHGTYVGGAAYIGRVSLDGTQGIEIALPETYTAYGHFSVGRPSHLVTDGYYRHSGTADHGAASRPGGDWITLLKVDWNGRRIMWLPVCRHGASWTSQDSHPHPIFNDAGDAVYFTSDCSNRRAVYRVDVRQHRRMLGKLKGG